MQVAEKPRRIPEISDEKIAELLQRIQPVVRMIHGKWKRKLLPDGGMRFWIKRSSRGRQYHPHKRGDLCYIKVPDPRRVAFPWDPKFQRYAHDLTPLCTITTYHTWGYYGFFKPSIAEVLAQIPEEYLDRVVAFETIGPEDADDLNKQIDIVNEGYHAAQTTLYIRN